MAIRNLQAGVLSAFIGKNTAQNPTDAALGTLSSAKNALVLNDGMIRRAPGYTKVTQIGSSKVIAIGDFERNVDSAHFVFVQTADGKITAMQPDGTGQVTLSTGESAAPFQFVQNAFICYASNGVNAYRFVDNAGVLTKYNWGMAASSSAPAISLSAGTLTLTWGRRYVYCPVSKYTDSLNIQRVSVGAPSPFSAHTGPIASQTVNLTGILNFTDPQVTHVWIFATSDSPLDTSSTFYFAAEITNGTTSWADSLLDSGLNQTKLAPFDNNPAPPSAILTTFQNRIVAVNGNQIRLSGFSEIPLGIPEEAWPLSLFFNVPSGSRKATAAITPDAGTSLVVDTADAKYRFTGYDATTFTEQDKIATPGAIGPLAQCITPFGVAFLSQSKRLWLWNANSGNPPTEISADMASSYLGTYGMEDLSNADLASAQLAWYSFGKVHFIALLTRTSDAPDANLNLIQLWSIPVKGSASSGLISGSSSFFNQIGGIYQSDKIPGVSMTAARVVKVNNQPFIFLGDASGNVYRFPDGYADNGGTYASSFSTPWSLLGYEGKKRMYWVDLYVQPVGSVLPAELPVDQYKVFAAVSNSAEDPPNWIPVTLQLIPAPDGASQYALRGDLQVSGLNVGRYIRLALQFPIQSTNDEILQKAIIWHTPMYQGMP